MPSEKMHFCKTNILIGLAVQDFRLATVHLGSFLGLLTEQVFREIHCKLVIAHLY